MSTANAGNRSRALKCHFCNPWDLHNYCPTYRESSKGDDNSVTGKGKCMVCASFTEEERQKIINRKRYVKKDKAEISDISKDKSELLGEPDQGDIFEGSLQELEQATHNIYQSLPKPSNFILGDPRPQVLGLDNLSLRTPQHVPETLSTTLQCKIEKSLGGQFPEQMGSIQRSMMDAFNKLAAICDCVQATPGSQLRTGGPK